MQKLYLHFPWHNLHNYSDNLGWAGCSMINIKRDGHCKQCYTTKMQSPSFNQTRMISWQLETAVNQYLACHNYGGDTHIFPHGPFSQNKTTVTGKYCTCLSRPHKHKTGIWNNQVWIQMMKSSPHCMQSVDHAQRQRTGCTNRCRILNLPNSWESHFCTSDPETALFTYILPSDNVGNNVELSQWPLLKQVSKISWHSWAITQSDKPMGWHMPNTQESVDTINHKKARKLPPSRVWLC